jgi:hypothetical protein
MPSAKQVTLQGATSIVSCMNIGVTGQIYGPGPIHGDPGWKFVIHFRFHKSRQPTPVITSPARNGCRFLNSSYFLMMAKRSPDWAAGQPFLRLDRCFLWTLKYEPCWIMRHCVDASQRRFRIRMRQTG